MKNTFKPGDRVVMSAKGMETFRSTQTIRRGVVVRVQENGMVLVRKSGKHGQPYHPDFWQLDEES